MEVVNFSAGPAVMPRSVLERTREALARTPPVATTSHRGPAYAEIHASVIAKVRGLLGLEDRFEVLLLQGGASQVFATAPLNFLGPGRRAGYVMTGVWSDKALAEAQRVSALVGGEAVACGGRRVDGAYVSVPSDAEIEVSEGDAYVHVTSNNTIIGTQLHRTPNLTAPLVADMSSDILSRPIPDINRFGLIYAGAQKNLGPAGVTLVLVRKDLLERAGEVPKIFSFATHAKAGGLYHTPPSLAVQMSDFVLDWISGSGGLEGMARRNEAKQRALYSAIDAAPDFFRSVVRIEDRSWMNVTFRLPSPELEASFVREAEAEGMIGLKGHRSVGGIRASLYNAIELAEVERLIEFMKDFAGRNG